MVNKLNIKINTKAYTVELTSDDPIAALKEMNKFLSLASEEMDSYKDIELMTDLDYDQYYFVPNDVKKNHKAMKYVADQMEVTDSRIYRKHVLPSMKLVNLDNKEIKTEVKGEDLKVMLNKLLHNIDKGLISSSLTNTIWKLSLCGRSVVSGIVIIFHIKVYRICSFISC
jgi:hypothetical protein